MSAARNVASRRRFLASGAAAVAGLAVAGASAPLVASNLAPNPAPAGAADWIRRLRGDERYLLDAPSVSDGRVLALIRHFLDTSIQAYGIPEDQVGVAGAFYSGTTLFGLTDAAWQRYQLGEFHTPAFGSQGNPWRATPLIAGKPVPAASIGALARRGAVFILCHAALATRAAQVAERRGLAPDRVLADFETQVLPQVLVVPSVIVEIQRAQRRGVAYYRVP